MKMIKTVLLIILLSFSTCNKEREKKVKAHDLPTHGYDFNDRLLQSRAWKKMNVEFYFEPDADIEIAKLMMLRLIIVPRLKEKFSRIFSVQGEGVIYPFDSTRCDEEFSVPQHFKENTTNADMIIFFKATTDPNIIVETRSCLFRIDNTRPIVGTLFFSTSFMKVDYASIGVVQDFLFHKIIHIFGFNKDMFDHFDSFLPVTKVEKEFRNGELKDVMYYVGPKGVQQARNHFNCSSLTRIRMENDLDGTYGSHLEKTQFGNEILTADIVGTLVLSAITLAILEDSRWYKADYTQAETLVFGRNQGCGFLERECDTQFAEFCENEGELNCSGDYKTKGFCIETPHSTGCFYTELFSDLECTTRYTLSETALFEESGAFSRCFDVLMDEKKSAGCFISECTSEGISVKIKKSIFQCTSEEDFFRYNEMTVMCPNYIDFCGRYNEGCPNECFGVGKCLVNGTCECDYLFSGDTCEEFNECNNDEPLCSLLSGVEDDAEAGVKGIPKPQPGQLVRKSRKEE